MAGVSNGADRRPEERIVPAVGTHARGIDDASLRYAPVVLHADFSPGHVRVDLETARAADEGRSSDVAGRAGTPGGETLTAR